MLVVVGRRSHARKPRLHLTLMHLGRVTATERFQPDADIQVVAATVDRALQGHDGNGLFLVAVERRAPAREVVRHAALTNNGGGNINRHEPTLAPTLAARTS